MISFYQHLVESGAIRPEALLELLDIRLQQAPSLARIAFEHAIVSESELNAILDLQDSEDLSFPEAFARIIGQEDSRFRELKVAATRTGPSLIQLLLERDVISVSNLISSLDEYLAKASKEIKQSNAA